MEERNTEKLREILDEMPEEEREELSRKYEVVTNEIYSGVGWSEEQEKAASILCDIIENQ